MDNFYNLALTRQSCRNFSTAPVEKDKLMQCIESALIAPSAVNGQPWHYTLVMNPEIVEKIAKSVQIAGFNKFADKAPAFVVVTQTATNLLSRTGEIATKQDYSSIDIGISIAHFVLCAQSLGLSTCIMGMFGQRELKKLLGIKKSDRIRIVIAVGYSHETDKYRTKRRKDKDKVLTVIE